MATSAPVLPGKGAPASEQQWRPKRRRNPARVALVAAVLGISLVFVLFPVYYVTTAAFDGTNRLGSLWPTTFTTKNFHTLLEDPSFPFLKWLANSLKVSLLVSAASVLMTTMGAYAFSRFRFRGRKVLMKSIVLVQLFPNLLALIAIYIMVQQIGRSVSWLGLNSPWSLILVYLGGVLGGNVWLMKGYLDSLPRELDESAMIDGAGHVTIFLRILLPLSRPMLAVVAVLSFVGTYGEVLLARVLLTDINQLTLAVGMWAYVSGQYTQRWGPFAAGALLASIPVLVFFYLLQDWLVSGLTQGSVKS